MAEIYLILGSFEQEKYGSFIVKQKIITPSSETIFEEKYSKIFILHQHEKFICKSLEIIRQIKNLVPFIYCSSSLYKDERINVFLKKYRGVNKGETTFIFGTRKYHFRKFSFLHPFSYFEKELKIKPLVQRVYYQVPMNIKKISRPSSTNQITLEQLKSEIQNPDFIENLRCSREALMTEKIHFYQNMICDIKVTINDEKRKMLKMNISDSQTKKDLYPLHLFYQSFIIDIEDLIEKIKNLSHNSASIKADIISAINDPIKGLNSIVGRDEIKNMIASQLYAFSKNYKSFLNSFNGIALFGNAGVGKTKLATTLGYFYSKVGMLATEQVVIVTRTDIVAPYIGQTGPRTRAVCMNSLEKVLFFDEAHQIGNPTNNKDFGSEAITELVNFWDKYIGMTIPIVGGYKDLMKDHFFKCNEGLDRRFPHQIVLENYSEKELADILISFITSSAPHIIITEKIQNLLFTIIIHLSAKWPNIFKSQAGDILNLSSAIIRSVESSFVVKWEDDNLVAISEGVNNFLISKGISVEIKKF